jgi:hypothetical protein
MIIALCDQNYVLNEENIMLGIYLYDKQIISCLQLNKLRFFQTTLHMTFLFILFPIYFDILVPQFYLIVF